MIWKDIGTKFDARVGKGTERLARRVSRRDALRTAVITGATTVGALALGQRPAFATVRCGPACGPSPRCSSGCPLTSGCPSGRVLCTKKAGFRCTCEWATGSWVYCSGYGRCGQGFTLCQDCIPTHSCGICICLSGILCGQCCSPTDVVEEIRRLDTHAAVVS